MFPQNRLGKEQGRGRKVRWPRSVSTVVLSASSMAVGPSPSRLPAMGFRVQNPGLCVRHVSPCGCACGLPRGGPWGGWCREPSGRSAELAAVGFAVRGGVAAGELCRPGAL